MKTLSSVARIIREAIDDDETLKDILGPDYMAPPEDKGVPSKVNRFDRWADIEIGDFNFCISYLTPVAVYEPGKGVKVTQKTWGPATCKHIVKWANYIGIGPYGGGYRTYRELRQSPHITTMPQEELTEMFKNHAKTVHWTKKEAKHATARPYTSNKHFPGLKSGYEDRIDIRPEP